MRGAYLKITDIVGVVEKNGLSHIMQILKVPVLSLKMVV